MKDVNIRHHFSISNGRDEPPATGDFRNSLSLHKLGGYKIRSYVYTYIHNRLVYIKSGGRRIDVGRRRTYI